MSAATTTQMIYDHKLLNVFVMPTFMRIDNTTRLQRIPQSDDNLIQSVQINSNFTIENLLQTIISKDDIVQLEREYNTLLMIDGELISSSNTNIMRSLEKVSGTTTTVYILFVPTEQNLKIIHSPITEVFIHFVQKQEKIKKCTPRFVTIKSTKFDDNIQSIKEYIIDQLHLNNITNINNCSLICCGHELQNHETLNDKLKYFPLTSILTFISNSTIDNLSDDDKILDSQRNKFYDFYAILLSIRFLLLHLIFHNKKYDKNFERFFRYCDRDRSLTLEKREIDIGLLTLCKLFNIKESKLWTKDKGLNHDHLSYSDIIPTIPYKQYDLNDFKHIFIDILVEYIRRTKFHLFYNKSFSIQHIYNEHFLIILDKMLNESMEIHSKQIVEDISLMHFICETLKFILLIIGFPIKVILESFHFITKKFSYTKICRYLLYVFTILILFPLSLFAYVPFINVGIYHYLSIKYPKELFEILFQTYWPVFLLIYFILIFSTEFIDKTFIRKKHLKLVQLTYEQSEIEIMETLADVIETQQDEYEKKQKHKRLKCLTGDNDKDKDENVHFLTRKNMYSSRTQLTKQIGSYNKMTFVQLIIIGIIVILFIVTGNSLIPLINWNSNETAIKFHYHYHRHHQTHQKHNSVDRLVKVIENTFIISNYLVYTLFLGTLFTSLSIYGSLARKLKNLMTCIDTNEHFLEMDSPFYFDITKSNSLEYVLAFIRNQTLKVDKNKIYIATIGFALIIDFGLALMGLIRLFLHKDKLGNLFTIFLLYNIIILSIFIIIFLAIVIYINKILTDDFLQLLRDKQKLITQLLIHYEKDLENLNKNSDDQLTRKMTSKINDLKINHNYLTNTIIYCTNSRKIQSIRLFGFFIVDTPLLLKVLAFIATGIGAVLRKKLTQLKI